MHSSRPRPDRGGWGAQAGSAEEFCAEFGPLNDEGERLFFGGTPSSDELEDIITRIRELGPPAEIADDFALLTEAFTLAARAVGGDAELTRRIDEFDEANERSSRPCATPATSTTATKPRSTDQLWCRMSGLSSFRCNWL